VKKGRKKSREKRGATARKNRKKGGEEKKISISHDHVSRNGIKPRKRKSDTAKRFRKKPHPAEKRKAQTGPDLRLPRPSAKRKGESAMALGEGFRTDRGKGGFGEKKNLRLPCATTPSRGRRAKERGTELRRAEKKKGDTSE